MKHSPQIPPPPESFFADYKSSKLYALDATLGHHRKGWNHNETRHLIIDVDPFDPKDRGLCGDDLETLVAKIKKTIDLRRIKQRLN